MEADQREVLMKVDKQQRGNEQAARQNVVLLLNLACLVPPHPLSPLALQYLNIKLTDISVTDPEKYPHMVSDGRGAKGGIWDGRREKCR